jgi:hypothetical protein
MNTSNGIAARLKTAPTFDFMSYDDRFLTPERRAELQAAAAAGDAYIVGGRSAELRGEGSTKATDFGGATPGDALSG